MNQFKWRIIQAPIPSSINTLFVFLFLVFASFNLHAAAAFPAEPRGGEIVNGTTVTFKIPVENADERYYSFKLMHEGKVITQPIFGYVSTSYAGAQLSLSGMPDNGGAYTWYVGWSSRDLSNGGNPEHTFGGYDFINGPSDSPVKPSLNSAQDSGSNVIFSWSPSQRAAQYRLQVATDGSFTAGNGLVVDQWVGGATAVSVDNFPDNGTTFYWRVAASNAVGYEFSSTSNFVNGPSSVPSTPTGVSATTNTSNGSIVSFQWSPSARATGYRLQVATDSAFSQKVLDESVGNYSGMTVNGFPNNGMVFYYRLAATNSRGSSNYSAVSQFVNTPSSSPSTPSLSSPSSGASLSGDTVSFRWAAASGAYDYTFELASNSNFEDAQVFANVGLGIDLSGMPENDMTLYWRVKANNSRGSSSYASRSFTSVPSAVPNPVSILTPAQGSTNNDSEVLFSWEHSTGATSYIFEVSSYSNMANAQSMTVAGTGVRMNGFPNYGQILYWRVIPQNSLGKNTNASINSFRDGSAPGVPSNLQPSSGIVEAEQLELTWSKPSNALWINYYLELDGQVQEVVENVGGNSTTVPNTPELGSSVVVGMQAANLAGTSGWVEVSFQFGEETAVACEPASRTMSGLLNSFGHVDYCTDDEDSYFKDVARRDTHADLSGHEHDGKMPDSSSIFSGLASSNPIGTIDEGLAKPELVDAHVNAGYVYDYLNSVHGLNSYDNRGASMRSVVDEACGSDNAWWSRNLYRVSYCEEVYLDHPTSVALDVVAHEWAHALTHTYAGDLRYQYDSGALNEAFSDWVGLTVEAYAGNLNFELGEATGRAFRNIQNPKAYNQPEAYGANYQNFFNTETCPVPDQNANDHCGVHTNSGVGNKMFYLLAFGGSHMGVNVTGIGLDNAMKIALAANKLWAYETSYPEARDDMIEVVNDPSLNLDPAFAISVAAAWDAVRVGVNTYTVDLQVNDSSAGAIGYKSLVNGVAANELSNPFSHYDVLEVQATANAGHALLHFIDQDGNIIANEGSAAQGYATLPALTKNLVITAVFTTEAEVILSTSGSGSGNVSGAGTYLVGEWVTLRATPDSGMLFDGWTGLQGVDVDGDASQPSIRVKVPTGGLSVTANFSIELYAINVSVSGDGSVTGGGSYPPNTSVTIEAIANSQSVFSGWSGDTHLGPSFNPLDVIVEYEDWYLVANFTPDVDDNSLPDDWESEHDVSDPNTDEDGDGLSNLEEYNLGLDPNSSDSDNDGINDSREIEKGTDPLVWEFHIEILIPIFSILM